MEDLSLLSESVDLECKLAQGQDGKGKIPKDFWSTYSAMANAHGGMVLLGVRENSGQFSVAGIENIEKVRTDLFNDLNNRSKVSANLLTDAHVEEVVLEGKSILAITIPAATRTQKPVFLHGQPLGNTYKRLHDGDRQCDEESVKRMLAEQIEDERDSRILPNFGMNDLDPDSLRIYRQMLRDEKPAHPYLEQDDFQFLQSLRGWRKDRQTGESGLTLAGLLMFGKWSAIQDAVPHYFVDYQERPEAKTELRWIDRLVPDGTWSGNLFEFYRRVYRKLIVDLKVPFMLKDGQRQDDTPVHVALREALVNTLVHADYTGRVSVLVVKRPDMFGFRNPGGLRLPIEQVVRGGESDCRNRILHQMFLLIGLGERGGSGMPKIYSGWKSQHWRPPALVEKDEPEQTLLSLRMVDLLPEPILAQLRARFGQAFELLTQTERLILATAAIERVVAHTRLVEICEEHPHDLSILLARMVKDGLLLSDGRSRGMVYYLHGESLPTPEQVFDSPSPLTFDPKIEHEMSGAEHATSGATTASSGHLTPSSGYLQIDATSQIQPPSNRDANGCLLSPYLDCPVIDDLDVLSKAFYLTLISTANEPRSRPKIAESEMREVILNLCQNHFLTLNVLAKLVDRNADALRKSYLNKMVKEKLIRLAFPKTPTHEKQAYRSI
jgi:predicted HTH transcriptional regulator